MLADASKYMLQACQEFRVCDESEDDKLPDGEIIEKYGTQQHLSFFKWMDIPALFPPKLLVVLLFTCAYVLDYFLTHCTYTADKRFVSQDMYLPNSPTMSIFNLLMKVWFPVESASEPYWT